MQPDIDELYRELALHRSASAEQVRSTYLKLVRQFPPDRDPDLFARINRAYQLLSDPLKLAEALIKEPDKEPDLEALVERLAGEPRRLTPDQLLSLGNQSR